VRGKPKTNVLIVVVGRVVVAVGRAQVDRLIVPGAPARLPRSTASSIAASRGCRNPSTQQSPDLVDQAGAVFVAPRLDQLERPTQPPVKPQLFQPNIRIVQEPTPLTALTLRGSDQQFVEIERGILDAQCHHETLALGEVHC
jgi:hypothetical protein